MNTITRAGLMLCVATLASAQSGITPQAKRLFDRHRAAIALSNGPRTAAEHTIATWELPGNQEMRVETFQSGDKLLSRTTMPGTGTIETGFDGRIGWQVSDALGARLLPRDSIPKFETQGNAWADTSIKAAVVGFSTIDGKAADVVRIETRGGASYVQYFDKESGLLVAQGPKFSPIRVDPVGLTTYREYKQFGAVLRPTIVSISGARGMSTTMRIVSIDNEPIDPAVFVVPESVRLLMKP